MTRKEETQPVPVRCFVCGKPYRPWMGTDMTTGKSMCLTHPETPVGVSIAGRSTTATTPTGHPDVHPFTSDPEGYCVECGEEREHVNHRRKFTVVPREETAS